MILFTSLQVSSLEFVLSDPYKVVIRGIKEGYVYVLITPLDLQRVFNIKVHDKFTQMHVYDKQYKNQLAL